jgi:hypothetical protein
MIADFDGPASRVVGGDDQNSAGVEEGVADPALLSEFGDGSGVEEACI